MHQQQLPTLIRLRGLKAINSLFTGGHSIRVGHLRGYYRLGDSPAGVVAVGFAVSRNIKRAMKRNRIKRLLREAWRKISPGVEAHCQTNRTTLELMILYTSGDDREEQTLAAIIADVAELSKRLMGQIQRKQ